MSNRIRLLEPSDVPQALALSQAAAWNQTPEDWSLAIEMNPDGCFAMELDHTVVATTTSIRYGTDLAWIGMVLTHPEFRGRGFAHALMHRALDHLQDVATVKLDATPMGEPLYRGLGFADECTIERWLRPAQMSPPIMADPYTPQAALDREAFGADRSALLERLATIEAASVGDVAFAMGREGRFGPCVSRSKEAALALAQWYLAHHPGQPVLWDLLPENNLAQTLGFEFSRRLTRMTRGPKLRTDNSLIYAGAGFEFG
jgi:GNAT superfamily N-acetyltransferase